MIKKGVLYKKAPNELKLWLISDKHHGVVANETTKVVQHMDGQSWDACFDIGDMVKPDTANDTGFSAYITEWDSFVNHSLNKTYHLIGNHDITDESDPSGADFYYKKWCSPIPGDNTRYVGQPYTPVGDYLFFTVTIGNMMIICLGDHNSGAAPGGEDGLGIGNANFRASGNIKQSQWDSLKSTVENNKDKILIVLSHIGIKDTTLGTGYGEFNAALKQQAFYTNSPPEDYDDVNRRGYIAYIENSEGVVNHGTGDSDTTDQIKTWLETNGQYIDLWATGHYHRKVGEVWAGKSRYEEKYGTRFLLASIANSKLALFYNGLLEVKSNMLEIKGNKMTIKTFVHYDPNSVIPQGEYAPEEINITLKRKFIS